MRQGEAQRRRIKRATGLVTVHGQRDRFFAFVHPARATLGAIVRRCSLRSVKMDWTVTTPPKNRYSTVTANRRRRRVVLLTRALGCPAVAGPCFGLLGSRYPGRAGVPSDRCVDVQSGVILSHLQPGARGDPAGRLCPETSAYA